MGTHVKQPKVDDVIQHEKHRSPINLCYIHVHTFLNTKPAQYEEAAAGNIMAALDLKLRFVSNLQAWGIRLFVNSNSIRFCHVVVLCLSTKCVHKLANLQVNT